MNACDHTGRFGADLEVTRLINTDGEVTGWAADIQLECCECGEKFVWLGPGGYHPQSPTVSIDGSKLRAPCVPRATGASILDRMSPQSKGDA